LGEDTLKRSNRLVLLVGVLMAVVAFGGVLTLTSQPAATPPPPAKFPTVVAKVDIPLGALVEDAMLDVTDKTALEQGTEGSYADKGLVIGKIARKKIVAGQQLTPALFDTSGALEVVDVPGGKRAIAVQVDQLSGAGNLIRQGDYVDVLLGLTSAQFPVITVNPTDQSITTVPGLNSTSVKLILQGIQVLGVLLPPVAPPAEGETAQPGTALTGAQALVILAVTPQQAEVIKFAQMDGSVSLVLRSPADFVDENNQPLAEVEVDPTTGVILKSLVDEYGLLVPQLIQTILPEGPLEE
jgi:pilus assembly protein CpaB